MHTKYLLQSSRLSKRKWSLSFGAHLIGVIIVEMENDGEKSGEKIIRKSVWLRGENERENGEV